MRTVEQLLAEALEMGSDLSADGAFAITALALAVLAKSGLAIVPVDPTEAMELAGGKANCKQIGCASEFEECTHCQGKIKLWNGKADHGDGCVNASIAAYRAMIAEATRPAP